MILQQQLMVSCEQEAETEPCKLPSVYWKRYSRGEVLWNTSVFRFLLPDRGGCVPIAAPVQLLVEFCQTPGSSNSSMLPEGLLQDFY